MEDTPPPPMLFLSSLCSQMDVLCFLLFLFDLPPNRHGLRGAPRVRRPSEALRKQGELGTAQRRRVFLARPQQWRFIHAGFVAVNKTPLLLLHWHPEREPPGACCFYIIGRVWSRGLASGKVTATLSWRLMAPLGSQFLSSRVTVRLCSASNVGLQASFSAAVAFPGNKKRGLLLRTRPLCSTRWSL